MKSDWREKFRGFVNDDGYMIHGNAIPRDLENFITQEITTAKKEECQRIIKLIEECDLTPEMEAKGIICTDTNNVRHRTFSSKRLEKLLKTLKGD